MTRNDNGFELEIKRADHLRNLQRGMIGNVEQPKKGFTYHLVQICMSVLLIAFTAWLIKLMFF